MRLGALRSTSPPSIRSGSTRYLSFHANSTLGLSIAGGHARPMVGRPTTDKKNALEQEAREQALRRALREVAPGSGAASRKAQRRAANHDRERRLWHSKALREEQFDFIRGITATATLLLQDRDVNGEPTYPTDARYILLTTLERIGGWPSISELARGLRVSKQAAREQVIGAARAGLLELLSDPYDRRSIQIGLTASGKRELAAVRARQFSLVATLLTGLEARDMRLVAHVLRVIRKRLLASRNPIG
jgi:MarR family transcriptional regulator, temperature-dependent positive regulator of motility